MVWELLSKLGSFSFAILLIFGTLGIAAGYLIQTTFESDFAQEVITLSQKAAIKQLQVWSEEDSDIQELIKSVNLPLNTNSPKGIEEKLNND